MEPIITSPSTIQSLLSGGMFYLLVGAAVLIGSVAVLFLAVWERKRKRIIC